MKPRTAVKVFYNSLAEAASESGLNSVAFRLVDMARKLAELVVPQRFSSTELVVTEPEHSHQASVRIWGNDSGVWYIRRILERSGLSVAEMSDQVEDDLPSSIRIVWHNRLLSRKFRRRGWLVLPGLVTSRLDLSGSLERIRSKFSRSAKRSVQGVKEAGYGYNVVPLGGTIPSTQGANHVRAGLASAHTLSLMDFYQQMYLPYSESRFSGNLIIKDYALVEGLAKGSCLLLVTRQAKKTTAAAPEVLGGVVIRRSGWSAALEISGLAGDMEKAMRECVVEALYWFAIEWCHQQGVRSLDLGLSHPFLDDGILRFKSKWGAEIEPSLTGIHNLAIRFEDNSWLGRHFLANHPPIIHYSRQLPTANCQLPTINHQPVVGLVCLPPSELTFEGLSGLKRRLLIGGLRELLVVSDPESIEEGEQLAIQVPGIRFVPCYDLRYLADMLDVGSMVGMDSMDG